MSDKVFLITGASSGIGAATARAAAAGGLPARARGPLGGQARRRSPRECGGPDRAVSVVTDVTSWEDNERLAAAALEAFGQIDVAFVNAGFGGKRSFKPDEADTVEHWRDMVLTNVLGAAYTIRATLPAILESQGHVLLTGSVAGRIAIPGSLYSSTKWAVTGMGQSLRGEVTGTGVRVTLIEPGMVDTPFFDNRPQHALVDDGHRERRDVRGLPARPRGRQRDPRAPGGAADLGRRRRAGAGRCPKPTAALPSASAIDRVVLRAHAARARRRSRRRRRRRSSAIAADQRAAISGSSAEATWIAMKPSSTSRAPSDRSDDLAAGVRRAVADPRLDRARSGAASMPRPMARRPAPSPFIARRALTTTRR